MPFILHNKPLIELKKYFNLGIRDSPEINASIERALATVEVDESCGAIWLFDNGNFGIKRNPKACLVSVCLQLGLNMAEIENWFDYKAENYDGQIAFSTESILRINRKKVYYQTPMGFPSSHLIYHKRK